MRQAVADREVRRHHGQRRRLHVQKRTGIGIRDIVALGVVSGARCHECCRDLAGDIPTDGPVIREEQCRAEERLEMQLHDVADPLGEAPADHVEFEVDLPSFVQQRQLPRSHL